MNITQEDIENEVKAGVAGLVFIMLIGTIIVGIIGYFLGWF